MRMKNIAAIEVHTTDRSNGSTSPYPNKIHCVIQKFVAQLFCKNIFGFLGAKFDVFDIENIIIFWSELTN